MYNCQKAAQTGYTNEDTELALLLTNKSKAEGSLFIDKTLKDKFALQVKANLAALSANLFANRGHHTSFQQWLLSLVFSAST